MLLAGAFIETLGVFLLSLSSKYWQIMLTQGILTGWAMGFYTYRVWLSSEDRSSATDR